jgi:hypothetical protein
MHTHGSQMNLNSINPYADAAEKAVAAQRAADLRRKLMKSATEIAGDSGGPSSPEETVMIGQWMGSPADVIQSPAQCAIPSAIPNQNQYHPSGSGKISAFG